MKSTVEDRAQGCLVGLALGDALGAPYEFRKEGFEVADTFGRGVFGTDPGAPTDDSTLALHLAEVLAQYPRRHITDCWRPYIERLVGWYDSHPPDVGGQTAHAIIRYKYADQKPEHNEHAQGNGSLMAAAAIGLRHIGDWSGAVESGVVFASWTHPSSAAAFVNSDYCQRIATLVAGDRTRESMGGMAMWPKELEHDHRWQTDGPEMGWCLGTYRLAARYTELTHRADAAMANLMHVIGRGGDTDTNAAVTGALLGAKFGMAAWPRQLVDALELAKPMAEAAVALVAR